MSKKNLQHNQLKQNKRLQLKTKASPIYTWILEKWHQHLVSPKSDCKVKQML
jgi:hypothetical protein